MIATTEEFERIWPEPPDEARIEWEDRGGMMYAAYRLDDPIDLTEPRWFVYGSDEAWTWRDLVFRYQLPAGLADVTVLVDARAERHRIGRYLDHAAASLRATGLPGDEVSANTLAEAAGWCRDETIWTGDGR